MTARYDPADAVINPAGYLLADRLLIADVLLLLDAMVLVFEHDWEYSKACIQDDYSIDRNGSFLRPFPPDPDPDRRVGDESSNWGNRGLLLSRWRRVVAGLAPTIEHVGHSGADLDLMSLIDHIRAGL